MRRCKQRRGTLTDIGATDAFPAPGLPCEIRDGYLNFCRKHPGFDDDALERERERHARLCRPCRMVKLTPVVA